MYYAVAVIRYDYMPEAYGSRFSSFSLWPPAWSCIRGKGYMELTLKCADVIMLWNTFVMISSSFSFCMTSLFGIVTTLTSWVLCRQVGWKTSGWMITVLRHWTTLRLSWHGVKTLLPLSTSCETHVYAFETFKSYSVWLVINMACKWESGWAFKLCAWHLSSPSQLVS